MYYHAEWMHPNFIFKNYEKYPQVMDTLNFDVVTDSKRGKNIYSYIMVVTMLTILSSVYPICVTIHYIVSSRIYVSGRGNWTIMLYLIIHENNNSRFSSVTLNLLKMEILYQQALTYMVLS